jgi:hypothetical protein
MGAVAMIVSPGEVWERSVGPKTEIPPKIKNSITLFYPLILFQKGQSYRIHEFRFWPESFLALQSKLGDAEYVSVRTAVACRRANGLWIGSRLLMNAAGWLRAKPPRRSLLFVRQTSRRWENDLRKGTKPHFRSGE